MKSFFVIIFFLTLLSPAFAQTGETEIPRPIVSGKYDEQAVINQTAEQEITTGELQEMISFLASDEMKGRETGSEHDSLAASYIRDQFKQAGTDLLFDDGFQHYQVIGDRSPGDENRLRINGTDATFGEDFIPLPLSENREFSGTILFAGYGMRVTSDELKWDDYEGQTLDGKWVLLFTGYPTQSQHASVFSELDGLHTKLLQAQDLHAEGVLLVVPSGENSEDDLLDWQDIKRKPAMKMAVVQITRRLADQILQTATNDGARGIPSSIEKVEEMINIRNTPLVFDLPVQVEAQIDLITDHLGTRNVVALVPGNDPDLRQEYIVLGAHFDHLGMGGKGTNSREQEIIAIHNGADDNASGTALMLELAEKFSAQRSQLRRSLLFVAFSGEEMGLLGSKHFVNHPPVGVEYMKAMFNFDMVGRLDPEKNTLTISGSGTSLEGDSILDVKVRSYPFKLNHSKGGSGGSDHASFYGKKIPVFFFFSGMHADYHKPTDDIDKINFQGMKQIGDFAFESILEIANMNQPLTFQEAASSGSRNGNYGMKVRLGIMPDISATDQIGLGVDGITPGLPAEKAGILKGDRIVSMDGQEVRNIQDYMSRMSKFKQGQTIPVEIIRNGEKMTLTVTF